MFHGIGVNKEDVVLDGSEAPIRIDAEALLASEKLAPAATLKKVKYLYFISISAGNFYTLLISFAYYCISSPPSCLICR